MKVDQLLTGTTPRTLKGYLCVSSHAARESGNGGDFYKNLSVLQETTMRIAARETTI